MVCNVCESQTFEDYAGRSKARCKTCHSLERHRILYDLFQARDLTNKTVLHHAPEAHIGKKLKKELSRNYFPVDIDPTKWHYPELGTEFCEFPTTLIAENTQYDLIIHLHVIEHIPGIAMDHIKVWYDHLKSGGEMLFSMPLKEERTVDIQGGEYLPNDDLRFAVFGQRDHFKILSSQFVSEFREFGGEFFKVKDEVSGRIEPFFSLRKEKQKDPI